jgi:hypothetical protein
MRMSQRLRWWHYGTLKTVKRAAGYLSGYLKYRYPVGYPAIKSGTGTYLADYRILNTPDYPAVFLVHPEDVSNVSGYKIRHTGVLPYWYILPRYAIFYI